MREFIEWLSKLPENDLSLLHGSLQGDYELIETPAITFEGEGNIFERTEAIDFLPHLQDEEKEALSQLIQAKDPVKLLTKLQLIIELLEIKKTKDKTLHAKIDQAHQHLLKFIAFVKNPRAFEQEDVVPAHASPAQSVAQEEVRAAEQKSQMVWPKFITMLTTQI